MVDKRVTRIGAAAFALGVSLTGPQCAGVAAAEGPDSDASVVSSTSAAQPAGSATPASGRAGRALRSAGTQRGVAAPAEAKARVPRQPRPAAATRGAATTPPGTAQGRRPGGNKDSADTAAGVNDLQLPAPRRARPVLSAAALAPVAAPAKPDWATSDWATAGGASSTGTPTTPTPPAAARRATGRTGCPACWGGAAAGPGQALTTVVNHLFNSTFDWLSTLPGGPVSELLTGSLALIRRSLFLFPEGVTASQTNTELTVTVNTGSVAYVRQDGNLIQVSGDPRFWGAKGFQADSIQTVTVDNKGNAGCAGFVLTSGAVTASLQTTQIDAIRFASDAAFTGEVAASVSSGPLTLRDSVTGLGGVDIAAPVVLGGDVAVNAGENGVRFGGTVDATKRGKQSLTVTALGTTTFEAAVGGVTPLAGLLTQGIAPLNVKESNDSRTIPLHFLPELGSTPPGDAKSPPGTKYGIDVAVGNNPSQVYEFDTGGTAFFAGYNQPFWTGIPLTTTPLDEVYNSGNYYTGVAASPVLTLGSGKQTVSSGQPITISAVLAGGNSKTGATFDFTNPDAPPVQGRFFGDFGASLAVSPGGITNPLLQLPGNLSSGFLVQLGPIGVTPQLTVGVTDQLRQQFTYAIPLIDSPDGGTYPISGYDVLAQFGFAPTYSVSKDGTTYTLGTIPPVLFTCPEQCLPTLIDSGAPTTGLRLDGKSPTPFVVPNGSQLQPGTTFKAVFPTTQGRPALTWDFIAGDNSSVNEVEYVATRKVDNPENVNVGLTLYNYFDVMFDVSEKTIWLRPTGGQSTVVLNSVTTTGAQTYRQNAQLDGTYTTGGGAFSVAGVTNLAGDTTVDAAGGDVTFSGTVDGLVPAGAQAPSLTVNSSGVTTFVRTVGGLSPLQSLVTDAAGRTVSAGVTTLGSQTYAGDVSLSGAYSVAAGSFSVAGATELAGPVGVFGGDIVFGGSVDAQSGHGFQLGLTPGDGKSATFNGAIGAVYPLGGLSLKSVGSSTITVNKAVTLQGNLGYASEKGIDVGTGVNAAFNGGGVIGNFSGAGIVVGTANPLEITDFNISGNGKEGIQANGSGPLQITGNVIVGNGTDGILLTDLTGASVTGNTIGNNTAHGVAVSGGSGSLIGANTITANGADGVHLEDTDDATVTLNTLGANGSDGVDVDKGTRAKIVANTITASGANGVYLNSTVNANVEDNVVTGNGTLASSTSATAAGGTIQANGIYARDSQGVAITDNNVSGNGVNAVVGTQTLTTYANGVYASGCTDVSIAGNTITGNGTGATTSADLTTYTAGVYLDDTSAPTSVTDNTISGNGSDGVSIRGGAGNEILSNSIFANSGRGIRLADGGNDGQPAPTVASAALQGQQLVVTGTLNALIGYPGRFSVQVFYSPTTDAPNVQGRQLLYTEDGLPAGPFTVQFAAPATGPGYITVTATPQSGPPNTSEFSNDATITGAAAV